MSVFAAWVHDSASHLWMSELTHCHFLKHSDHADAVSFLFCKPFCFAYECMIHWQQKILKIPRDIRNKITWNPILKTLSHILYFQMLGYILVELIVSINCTPYARHWDILFWHHLLYAFSSAWIFHVLLWLFNFLLYVLFHVIKNP